MIQDAINKLRDVKKTLKDDCLIIEGLRHLVMKKKQLNVQKFCVVTTVEGIQTKTTLEIKNIEDE